MMLFSGSDAFLGEQFALRQDFYAILRKNRVHGNDRASQALGTGDDEPVERIAMMRRQSCGGAAESRIH